VSLAPIPRFSNLVPPDPRDVLERTVVALGVLGVSQHGTRRPERRVGLESSVESPVVGREPLDGRISSEDIGVVSVDRSIGIADAGIEVVDGRVGVGRIAAVRASVGRPRCVRTCIVRARRRVEPGADDQLGGGESGDLLGHRPGVAVGDETLAGGDVDDRQSERRGGPVVVDIAAGVGDALARDRADVRRRARLDQLVVDGGSRREHLGHRAVDEAARRRGVFDLFGERDPVVGLEQRLEVRRGGVDRDPRHRVLPGRVGALGERHLADAGDRLGRLTERLVEVADLEQHERVLVGGTQVGVL
jgi:hypothetical protein